MKLFVKTQGKVIGPLEWERILLAEDKGRFSPDTLVTEDKVNWMTIDAFRNNLSRPAGNNQGGNDAPGYYQPQGNEPPMVPQLPYAYNLRVDSSGSQSRNMLFFGSMVALLIVVFTLIAVVVGICLRNPQGNYEAIEKHINLWMQASQSESRDVTLYASGTDFLISPTSWKIVSPKSDFDSNEKSYHVKVLVDSANKDGSPIRATWDFTIERDKKRPTGYCITHIDHVSNKKE